MEASVAAQILTTHGVSAAVVQKTCNEVATQGGAFDYSLIASEAITARTQFDYQFIRDLFTKLDADGSGALSLDELRQLLRSKALSCLTSIALSTPSVQTCSRCWS